MGHHPITLNPALNSILQAFPSSLLLIKLFMALCTPHHHSASFLFTLFQSFRSSYSIRALRAFLVSELSELMSFQSFQTSGKHIFCHLGFRSQGRPGRVLPVKETVLWTAGFQRYSGDTRDTWETPERHRKDTGQCGMPRMPKRHAFRTGFQRHQQGIVTPLFFS